VTALTISGKPTDSFSFEGFLSNKSARRRNQLAKLREEGRTVVLYESPHRIVKMLEEVREVYGDVEVVLARELTKKFEEVRREKISAAIAHFSTERPRGEFIVIL